MGDVQIHLESCGLDRVRVRELVHGKLRRELEIDLAELTFEKRLSAIGAVVLGRIAMCETGCFSRDFSENAHAFAEAMAETDNPELLHDAFLSASVRAGVYKDVSAIERAETFLLRAQARGSEEATRSLESWADRKAVLLKWIHPESDGDN